MNFIVDVNLPKHFSFFNHSQFVFASDIDKRMSDTELWNYSLKNNLVILTKDSDFYSRSIIASVKPKVVFFKTGNMKLSVLNKYFLKNWGTIQNLIQENFLVVANAESIDVIL